MRTITWILVGIMMCACASATAQKQVKRKGASTAATQGSKQTTSKLTPIQSWGASAWSGPASATGGQSEVLPSLQEMTALGADAFRRNEYAEALRWCGLAARQGSADSQMLLGDIYFYGKGVEENHEEAAKWYRKAAGQNHSRAQFTLGTLLYFGDGVPQDYAEALNWAKKAAENGDPGGQFLLGEIYSNGQGVPVSIEEARKWYRLSAEQGNAAARKALNEL